jgi:hypothetical protein
MLSVTCKPVMLSVVMLDVIILSVIAPPKIDHFLIHKISFSTQLKFTLAKFTAKNVCIYPLPLHSLRGKPQYS